MFSEDSADPGKSDDTLTVVTMLIAVLDGLIEGMVMILSFTVTMMVCLCVFVILDEAGTVKLCTTVPAIMTVTAERVPQRLSSESKND